MADTNQEIGLMHSLLRNDIEPGRLSYTIFNKCHKMNKFARYFKYQFNYDLDEITPYGLIIKHPVGWTIRGLDTFDIYAFYSKIIRIPFALIVATSEIMQLSETSTCIRFNNTFDIYCDSIKLMRLDYGDIAYHVMYSDDYYSAPSEIQVLVKYKMHKIDEGRSIVHIPIMETDVQQVDTRIIGAKACATGEDVELCLNGLVKGFFIEHGHFADIQHLAIKFIVTDASTSVEDTFTFFEYNAEMVHIICKRISPELLYVPFNVEEDWMKRDLLSFRGGIHFGSIKSDGKVILNIQYKGEHIQPVRLHLLRYDVLVDANSSIRLKYSGNRMSQYI